jgi:hypothetical protein
MNAAGKALASGIGLLPVLTARQRQKRSDVPGSQNSARARGFCLLTSVS